MTEDVAEQDQMTEEEMDAAFDEAAEADGGTVEKNSTSGEKEEKGAESADNESGKGSSGKDPVEEARAEAERRVKEIEERQKQEALDELAKKAMSEKSASELAAAAGSEARKGLTREELFTSLADVDIQTASGPMKFSEYVESLSEEAQIAFHIALKINESFGVGYDKRLAAIEEKYAKEADKEDLKALAKELAKKEHGGHSDALEIRESEEFVNWFYKQTDSVKSLGASSNPKNVGTLLTLYKAENGLLKKSPARERFNDHRAIHKATFANKGSDGVGSGKRDGDDLSEEEQDAIFDAESRKSRFFMGK